MTRARDTPPAALAGVRSAARSRAKPGAAGSARRLVRSTNLRSGVRCVDVVNDCLHFVHDDLHEDLHDDHHDIYRDIYCDKLSRSFMRPYQRDSLNRNTKTPRRTLTPVGARL